MYECGAGSKCANGPVAYLVRSTYERDARCATYTHGRSGQYVSHLFLSSAGSLPPNLTTPAVLLALADAHETLARRRRRLIKTLTRGVDALLDPGILEHTPHLATPGLGAVTGTSLGMGQACMGDDPLALALSGTSRVPPLAIAASGLLRAGWGACMV